jgi:hypothetical protein
MFDKNLEFKGLPVLNMHFSDENSTSIEDDITVDQKVQTIDFWTGRTIFKYGDESGNSNQFRPPIKEQTWTTSGQEGCQEREEISKVQKH